MDPNEQRPAKRVNNANSKPKRERTDAKTQFSQRAFEGQYSYICIDRPLWGREDADDPELEHDELPEDEESDRLWQKPAAEHPEWKWVLLKESFEMLNEWCRLAQYCDPDSFGMYVFNDFHGYGLIEILENAVSNYTYLAIVFFFWLLMMAFPSTVQGVQQRTHAVQETVQLPSDVGDCEHSSSIPQSRCFYPVLDGR